MQRRNLALTVHAMRNLALSLQVLEWGLAWGPVRVQGGCTSLFLTLETRMADSMLLTQPSQLAVVALINGVFLMVGCVRERH